jgi:hypothetical protein
MIRLAFSVAFNGIVPQSPLAMHGELYTEAIA